MKKHHGMRPQDIVVLLKIAAKHETPWLMKDLAAELKISPSEVSESVNRSVLAGLLAADKRTLMKGALLDFLKHGLRFVFPQVPGSLVRGMATAHSAPPLNAIIQSGESYVWSWAKGDVRGQSIIPLHPSVPEACLRDSVLYELLSLTDALRIGKVREQQLAMKELEKRIG
ncbi:MAG: hypothetical protein WCT99_10480 [Bacteroidota bacterium]|jgi:hypothetical protein